MPAEEIDPTRKFEAALDALPLVAILRGLTNEEAIPVGQALHDGGWRLIEVPLNSPRPLESIERLAAQFDQALVGAGTVMSVDDVRDVHAAGGRLIVAPNFDERVVRASVERGMVCLPGVLTPTEAFAALAAGAHGIKLFPAEVAPPAVVKALRAVLPAAARVFPVGGITTANMAAYRAAGASGFGIGSALYKPGRPVDELHEAARDFASAYATIARQ